MLKDHQAERPVPPASKLMAVCLTACVYAVIAVMASQTGTYTPPVRPQRAEVTGVMPPVLLAEKSVRRSSRQSWILAEPPRDAPSTSLSSAGNGPTIGFAFGDGRGNGAPRQGPCYDAAWAKAVNGKVRGLLPDPPPKRDGVAYVRFVVRRDGKLEQIEIVKSSGDRRLDDAAYRMVHDAQPLPRIPRWMGLDKVDAVLPIAFGALADKFKPAEGNCAPDPVLNREM